MDTSINTVIVGLGKTGFSCVEYFSRRDEACRVVDSRVSPPLLKALRNRFPEVDFQTLDHASVILEQADRIVLSPGVNSHSLRQSINPIKQQEWLGDITLFCREARAPIIAITGSNGKTTVATLMGEVIRASGLSVEVCGNIGEPVLNALLRPVPDYYVLELSSFQLELVDSLAAEVAVVLNVDPDHMDRYESFEDYLRAKQKIYHACEYAVINYDQIHCRQLAPLSAKTLSFSGFPGFPVDYGVENQQGNIYLTGHGQVILSTCEMFLKGVHHWKNALVVLALADVLGLPRAAVVSVLKTFRGLPHRCELISERRGVTWYNDSKATNIAATQAAIISLSASVSGSLILIMGGDAKDADFSPLVPIMKEHVSHVITLGKDAELIELAMSDQVTLSRVQSLSEAVLKALSFVEPGDVVALSPACASLDMFESYQHRGDLFRQCVSELI